MGERQIVMKERNLDFDKSVDRYNTKCFKFDGVKRFGHPEGTLPLWVADMDFRTSSFVEDALKKRAEHGIYGYSFEDDDYFEAVKGWMKCRHDWDVKRSWLVTTPGVVFAVSIAVRAFTKDGDAVIIQQPVYYPFANLIEDNGRKMIHSDLILTDEGYRMDFEDFEKKIVYNNVKMFILCSPHNPVGRVWTREELERVGDICLKHGVIVVSDEIHSDFVFKGKHTVFSSIKKEFEDNCIICTAPSKTFNLAGLCNSNIFIPNSELKKKFKAETDKLGISDGIMGLESCEAAYAHGEEWYKGVYDYIRRNIEFVKEFVETKLHNIKMIETEGTYLVWLDFRNTGLSNEEIEDKMKNEAKLWLDGGAMFGKAGEGFQRINAACPKSTLEEALKRIEKTF